MGDWAHVVALAVYAYDSGGVLAVRVVGLLGVLPSALAVPFASLLADAFPGNASSCTCMRHVPSLLRLGLR